MKIHKINQTSFGWRDTTHKEIVATVLKDYPNLQQYEPLLEKFVQQPDYDEIGLSSNTHFYFPPKGSETEKSYIDIDGKHNAFFCYISHVAYMQYYIKTGDMPKAFEQAGRALHFLQDVSQPHHTHRGSTIEKAHEIEIHSEFEAFAQNNQEKFINSAMLSSPKQSSNDFNDIFIKTAEYSETSTIASEANKNDWNNLAQDGINNGVNATKEFINKLNSLLTQKT